MVWSDRVVLASTVALLLLAILVTSGDASQQRRLPPRIGTVSSLPFSTLDRSVSSSSCRLATKKRPHSLLSFKDTVWGVRGGARASSVLDEDDDEYDDDGAEMEDSFDSFDEMMDADVSESDFAEDTTVDRMVDAWKKTPPFTKAYLTASFAATLYGYLFEKNQFPEIFKLDWKPVFGRLQVWRLFTSFLNFGPLGLGYIMTAHFVWTYMSTLERLNHNRPYDFWIMTLFGQVSMLLGYSLILRGVVSTGFLGHNLSTFFVYIWSRYHEGLQVSMFDLFTTRAEMLPWFFLAQTFLLEGQPPILDFLGIVFGHLYHHYKSVGVLRAPPALVEWYSKSDSAKRIRELYKPISSDFEIQ